MRYSFVITPVNYSLAAVNCFVGATGMASLYRAVRSVLFSFLFFTYSLSLPLSTAPPTRGPRSIVRRRS